MTVWPYLFQLPPFLFLFYMAVEIYTRDKHNGLHRSTSMLLLSVSAMFLGQFLSNIVPYPEAEPLIRYVMLPSGFVIMSAALLFFSQLGRTPTALPIRLLLVGIPLSGPFVLWLFPSWVQLQIEQGAYWRQGVFGSGFHWYVTGMAAYTLTGLLFFLIRAIRANRHHGDAKLELKRLRLILYGALVSSAWLILAFLTRQSASEWLPFLPNATASAYAAIFFALFIRYVVMNHGFLATASKRYEILFDNSMLGIVLLDEQNRMLQANEEFLRILGMNSFAKEQWMGKNPARYIKLDPQTYARLGEAYAKRRKIQQELVIENYRQAERTLEVHTTYIEAEGQLLTYWIVKDITVQKKHEDMLSVLAYNDPLTGLANRRRFYETLVAVQQSAMDAEAITVMLIDLDHFKSVNDTLGHAAGDDLLARVAGFLREAVPADACIARLGGDEFAVLFPARLDVAAACRSAQQLLDRFNEPSERSGIPHQVTASIGLSRTAVNYDDPEAVLRLADTAMYAAKHKGRNQYVLVDEG
ncbi:sensor domain-containing diguanylate cyclase [Paenibacillus methanolicus]|uniref:PAS domain S-box-containing protein/diguanylate cyclase (GGDEF)-like protein n=1 Tax=Paenibacillus methanolicus TaxID=582686 RepID=A0A5S5C012_9BACL|nr:sensor domain-containing diguanylate cyclase [Paenibacillus methanolicus]TYP71782.1 PAS domain S-box-containing protein/diguanylate cyclase (GGDEF)-like protein [Paenibacillus methanolicus]